MAFEIDRQDPCVAVDKELGLIRIQDVSARTIYQGNIFDIYRNILSLLNNKEPNAPIIFYKNAVAVFLHCEPFSLFRIFRKRG